MKVDSVSILGLSSIIGIEEIKDEPNLYNVYPTITTNEVEIYSATFSGKGFIYLSDALGKLILNKDLKENKTIINLHSLNEGIYFITIIDENYSKTFKVIKTE
ncbi:MAG: T9SS type A sorting domain-containing protein [Sphingobacteriaceae bacterium]|nr:T9SS type A sorting domain-containing protein [Sphingobacteriaceae bacterium]